MKKEGTKKGRNVLYYIGNGLLFLSVIVFILVFLPIAKVYVFPPQIKQQLPNTGVYITIPKIHAQSPIVVGVDPSNQAVYDAALKHGVAQAKGTALPPEKGTVYLFAHSSGPPWDETYFNTIFVRLGDLQKGDLIVLRRNGVNYDYRVRMKKVVDPSQVSYLLDDKRTQLILQTCTPIGTSLYRLLVFADPVAH